MKLFSIEHLPDGSPIVIDLNEFVGSVRATFSDSDKQSIAQVFVAHVEDMMRQIRNRATGEMGSLRLDS